MRPILLYASSVFINSPASTLRPLQTKQNKILKCMLGFLWFTKTDLVHHLANILLINDQMSKVHLKFKIKTKNSNNPLVNSLFM